jgi:hypothetical protein
MNTVKSFPNQHYYDGKLTEQEQEDLTIAVNKIWDSEHKIPVNEQLAGHIESEFVLTFTAKKIILPRIYEGVTKICESEGRPVHKWHCDTAWVNFQKKYEVNPCHIHSGNYSFVLWLNIPFNYEDETNRKEVVKSTQSHQASTFCAAYTDITGNIRLENFFLDKKDNGKFIIFPSKLAHFVYPFYTSEDYRISISGNID